VGFLTAGFGGVSTKHLKKRGAKMSFRRVKTSLFWLWKIGRFFVILGTKIEIFCERKTFS